MCCSFKNRLEKEADLNMAVYNIVMMQERRKFTIADIIKELEHYEMDSLKQDVGESVKRLILSWVDSGIIQEYLNSFALVR